MAPFRTYLRVVLGTGALLALLHVVWFAWFYANPRGFYFRAWEWFGEFTYRTPVVANHWEGEEQGDLTRPYFFYSAGYVSTVVNAEPDGFRRVPERVERFPVVFSGDSMIFGSRLSDEETLPWLLTERTGVPVLNAGRTRLFNALLRPDARDARLIIDSRLEREIRGKEKNGADAYEPIAENDLDYLGAVLAVNPRRYSPPYRLWIGGERILRDVRQYFFHTQPEWYWFRRFRKTPTDLERAVVNLTERARIIEGQGKRYVFVPTPGKQTLYSDRVDDFTRTFIPRLVERLRANDVEVVDILPRFLAEKARGLYHRYDTHWNADGAALAASLIEPVIYESFPEARGRGGAAS